MNRDFLGRGWSFPIQVDTATGKIKMSEYSDDIREAIRILIRTSPGERVMNPDYGCRIRRYQFDSIDVTTLHLMASSVKDAIERWEPRVTAVRVTALSDQQENGLVQLEVEYRERSTNHVTNQVYPFYIYEGTG
ncbi:GPW/gp25 family protein [Paenibacillus nicotianae]|uniref:GPW/gp25 family protein n=1 Tax=Paenibacillus nicotianae TaxID=1526551 RepID=A0ABW4V1X8_9BACL